MTHSAPRIGTIYTQTVVWKMMRDAKLYEHLPNLVSGIILSSGGTVVTPNSSKDLACNAGDSLIWDEEGRFWIVEASGMKVYREIAWPTT